METQEVTVRWRDNTTTTMRGLVCGEWALVDDGGIDVSYTHIPTGQGIPCFPDVNQRRQLLAVLEALATLPPCPEPPEDVTAYALKQKPMSEAYKAWIGQVAAVLAPVRW